MPEAVVECWCGLVAHMEGKLVLCPEFPSRNDRVPLQSEAISPAAQPPPATVGALV